MWLVRSVPKDSVRFTTIAAFHKKKYAKLMLNLLNKSVFNSNQYWIEEYEREEDKTQN